MPYTLKLANAAAINLHENGAFGIQLQSFELFNCNSYLVVDEKKEDILWKQCVDHNVFTATTYSGEWFLKFMSSEGNCISLQIKGTLSRQIEKLKISVLHVPEINASHLLTNWVAMGGCKLIDLSKSPDTKFESYFQTIISENGKHLHISTPLKTEDKAYMRGYAKENSLHNWGECDSNTRRHNQQIYSL